MNDAIIDNWSRMCETMRSRPGADKVGENVFKNAYTASGIQCCAVALRPHPVQIVWLSPDIIHHIGLNSAIALLSFVRASGKKIDPSLVCHFFLRSWGQLLLEMARNLSKSVCRAFHARRTATAGGGRIPSRCRA